jgi:hypothetical protein
MNLLSHLIMVVKDQLSIIIQPIEGQVFDTYRRPLVEDLSACTIDYMSDLVCNYEL